MIGSAVAALRDLAARNPEGTAAFVVIVAVCAVALLYRLLSGPNPAPPPPDPGEEEDRAS